MEPTSSERAQSRADRARVAAEAARIRVNPFVIEVRTSGIDWKAISEREFTSNVEDSETGMAPRPLDECRAYMRTAVGLHRIAPA